MQPSVRLTSFFAGVVDWSGEAPAPELYKRSPTKSQTGGAPKEVDPFEPALSQVRESHLQKLTSLYLDMRECMGHALGERERCVNQRKVSFVIMLRVMKQYL